MYFYSDPNYSDSSPFLFFLYDSNLEAPLMHGRIIDVEGEIIGPDGELIVDEDGNEFCQPKENVQEG